MKKLIVCLSLVFIYLFGMAQAVKKTKVNDKVNYFPQNFIGHWKGKLQWQRVGKPSQTFTMQLIVQPADTIGQYTWQIIYGDSATDNRPYILKPIDTANGHWTIDETDGIVLDSYVFNNNIKGAFTVMNNTIIANYSVEKNKMMVEFFTINLSKKTTSGKGTEAVPFVDSYTIGSFQTGVLFKVK
jgi:hypothetical protein